MSLHQPEVPQGKPSIWGMNNYWPTFNLSFSEVGFITWRNTIFATRLLVQLKQLRKNVVKSLKVLQIATSKRSSDKVIRFCHLFSFSEELHPQNWINPFYYPYFVIQKVEILRLLAWGILRRTGFHLFFFLFHYCSDHSPFIIEGFSPKRIKIVKKKEEKSESICSLINHKIPNVENVFRNLYMNFSESLGSTYVLEKIRQLTVK